MKRRELLKALALYLGTSLTSTAAQAVLAGVNTDSPIDAPTLTPQHLKVIARISELILPTTDTPGAIAAGVPEFIHIIHAEWYRPEEREQFTLGLQVLELSSRDLYQQEFLGCSAEQQASILREAEVESADPDSVTGQFFATMKELTVFGYYTSEIGARQELIFNPLPMRYKGDYLFADVGRQWTT